MAGSRSNRSGHKLETVSRACKVLRLFEGDQHLLSLAEVAQQTGFELTITFRLLHTLEEGGLLRRFDGRRYAANFHLFTHKRFRVGYASQGGDSFSQAVTQGVRWHAGRNGIDLIEVENQYSAKAALRNAQTLVKQNVDLVIEFQVYERIGPQLAAIYEQAGIPVIAIEIPHPGAIFFGVDNFRVGQLAGRALVKAAQAHWNGEVEELLMLDLEVAGSLPHLRLSGAQAAIRKSLSGGYQVLHLDSRGQMERSFELVRRHLRFAPKRRTLIAGINDLAVLGALRAFEEVGRSEFCFAVGVGALPEARREMRSPKTRLVGSVANFPERYGDGLVQLALDMLHQKPVQPAVYAPLQLITAANLDEFYPRNLYAGEESQTRALRR